MFLGIFLTRAVPVLRQSYFSLTSLQYQLVAWHPCVADFITSVSLAAFSSDAGLVAQCWGSIMATVNHLSSVPSSSALCEAESLKMSPPTSENRHNDFWEIMPRKRIKVLLACVLVILLLGLCSKKIIWNYLVIVAGSYCTLTVGQHCLNCC